MGIGGCVLLMAGGAILLFGVDWQMESVNLDVVGVILMVVGLIGVLTFTNVYKRRRTVPPPPEGNQHNTRDYRIIDE